MNRKPQKVPAPGLGNKVSRLCWQIVWLTLYRPSPVPLHAWRRFLLRCFRAEVGPGAHPYPSARVWAPWNLSLGADACLGPHCDIYNVARVRLGTGAIVSQKAYLCTASHEIHEPGFALTAAPITLGDGAWVAAAAFVAPGITIGDNAVVGACSVVTRDISPGQVAAGNPARPLTTSAALERLAPEPRRAYAKAVSAR